ncbi:MAG TPA: alpha/beta hydrolase [Candidatus Baltobacteraceae bacterium]|jgi:pimeloyl-ACP methyl ester carboxylesterase|nr:alpha/beta hydrolase [Candidatus Baltobacteraceae bacterium]
MPTYRASDASLLAYRQAGQGGNALVFIHGWQADGRIWEPVIHELRGEIHSVSLDLRGCGGSAPAPGPFTIEQLARDVGDAVHALGLAPAAIVGHSMGGAIALRLAIDDPSAVRALVLIAGIPVDGLHFSPKIDALFRSVPGNPAGTRLWLSGLPLHPFSPANLEMLLAAAATVRPQAARESYASWTNLNFRSELGRIRAPTVVIAPEGDQPMTPQLMRERLADPIIGSRFVVLPDSGHYAPVEQPFAVAAEIRAALLSLH